MPLKHACGLRHKAQETRDKGRTGRSLFPQTDPAGGQSRTEGRRGPGSLAGVVRGFFLFVDRRQSFLTNRSVRETPRNVPKTDIVQRSELGVRWGERGVRDAGGLGGDKRRNGPRRDPLNQPGPGWVTGGAGPRSLLSPLTSVKVKDTSPPAPPQSGCEKCEAARFFRPPNRCTPGSGS